MSRFSHWKDGMTFSHRKTLTCFFFLFYYFLFFKYKRSFLRRHHGFTLPYIQIYILPTQWVKEFCFVFFFLDPFSFEPSDSGSRRPSRTRVWCSCCTRIWKAENVLDFCLHSWIIFSLLCVSRNGQVQRKKIKNFQENKLRSAMKKEYVGFPTVLLQQAL